jgi:hypothetical protein
MHRKSTHPRNLPRKNNRKVSKQQNLWERADTRVVSERESTQFSNEWEGSIGENIIASLSARFKSLNDSDGDVRILLSISAELRQWLHGQKGLEIKEKAALPQQQQEEDPTSALKEFKENWNAVRKSRAVG